MKNFHETFDTNKNEVINPNKDLSEKGYDNTVEDMSSKGLKRKISNDNASNSDLNLNKKFKQSHGTKRKQDQDISYLNKKPRFTPMLNRWQSIW